MKLVFFTTLGGGLTAAQWCEQQNFPPSIFTRFRFVHRTIKNLVANIFYRKIKNTVTQMIINTQNYYEFADWICTCLITN